MKKYTLIELISDYDSMARIYKKHFNKEGVLYCKKIELKDNLLRIAATFIGKPTTQFGSIKHLIEKLVHNFWINNADLFDKNDLFVRVTSDDDGNVNCELR